MFIHFGAIKGRQGGYDYYTIQVPFAALSDSFVFDDENLPIHSRCQREINLARAKKFAEYMDKNPTNFITGAVIGTVDNSVEFIPLDGKFTDGTVGVLRMPLNHKIVLSDGQHRQRGIQIAYEDKPTVYADQTIPVVLYCATDIERKQQIFSDVNFKSVKPSSSLAITFDHRSNFLNFVKEVAKEVPYLNKAIEYEKSSVSANSSRLWPLVSFKSFIINLTGLTETNFDANIADEKIRKVIKETVVNFIEGLSNLPYWYEITHRRIDLKQVRQDYIVAHAVFLEALGIYGRQLIQHFDDIGQIDWTLMRKLSNVDVAKENWIGRCLSPQMTIQKNQFGIKSTAAKICTIAEVPLSQQLADIESSVS